ncbi:MAG: stage II sporulation protein P [Bacilli bacterium]|jgi:stage II sporulation protein P
MKKRFKKPKNYFSFKKIKYVFLILIVYLSYDYTYSYLISNNIKMTNEAFLQLLITEGNHHVLTGYRPKSLVNEIISNLYKIDINKPVSLLGINLFDQDLLALNTETHHDEYNPYELEKVTEYIKDPNPININNPLVYIYNSHQLENYHPKYLEIYNITPNVMMASYMLKEKLNNLGIKTIVEEANLIEFMRLNNWNHASSYKASRIFMLDAKNKYSSLEFYLDIHRDSIKRNASTISINGKSYAKILLLIGLENPQYKENLKMAEAINSLLNKHYPGLSRGILKKQGKGVDGIYNQDISPQALLIEIGGVDNNIEEVLNTVEAFSLVFSKYVNNYD